MHIEMTPEAPFSPAKSRSTRRHSNCGSSSTFHSLLAKSQCPEPPVKSNLSIGSVHAPFGRNRDSSSMYGSNGGGIATSHTAQATYE